jgi:hypothetical protein
MHPAIQNLINFYKDSREYKKYRSNDKISNKSLESISNLIQDISVLAKKNLN